MSVVNGPPVGVSMGEGDTGLESMTHNVTRHKAAPAAPRALTRVNRSTSLRPRIAVGAVLATLAAGGVVGLASHKTVTLDVDGQSRTVSTMALSVDSVLRAQGYTPVPADVVVPAAAAKLRDGQTVTFKRHKQVTPDLDGPPCRWPAR